MPSGRASKYGLMYSHTTSPSVVTWKMRPKLPSVISVLPLGSLRAPEMYGLKKLKGGESWYSHTISFVAGSISMTRDAGAAR